MKEDAVLEFMKQNGIPMTREDYLEIAYMGNPPAELDAEEEAQLPEQFRKQDVEDDEIVSRINKRAASKLGGK